MGMLRDDAPTIAPIIAKTGTINGIAKQASTNELLRQSLMEWLAIIGLSFLSISLTSLMSEFAGLTRYGLVSFLVLVIILLAGRYHALGVILHDACHMRNPPRGLKRLLLEVLSGFPIASTVASMRYHHLRHHRHSCMELDPYFKPQTNRLLFRWMFTIVGAATVVFWSLRALLGTAIVIARQASGATPSRLLDAYQFGLLQDRSRRAGVVASGGNEALRCAYSDPAQLVFLCVCLVLSGYWLTEMVLVYWLPVLIAGSLNANRVIVEHVHVFRAAATRESMLETTRTHDWGLPGRLFLFPRNIGFHHAHHLYPTASLNTLPALDTWLRETGQVCASRGHRNQA